MHVPPKFAFFTDEKTSVHYRLLSGVARYVDAHQPIILRDFPQAKNPPAAAIEMEKWGVTGILASLTQVGLPEFLGALTRPIPIVNIGLTNVYPMVLTIVTEAQAVFEQEVNHFRKLGLRSMACLRTEEFPPARNLVDLFLRIANPPSPSRASLMFTADLDKLSNPNKPVEPVPAVLADWLHALPKPTGILALSTGSGPYLVQCCQTLGLRVPEDIAIICADETDLCMACSPTVTSIVPAHESVGFESARALQEFVEGKRRGGTTVRFRNFKLNVSESTGQRRQSIISKKQPVT